MTKHMVYVSQNILENLLEKIIYYFAVLLLNISFKNNLFRINQILCIFMYALLKTNSDCDRNYE